jgi:catechol 2,3-dioxygenase-like lactoylglutathione lyase family enzyme
MEASLHHTAIAVQQIEKARHFYCDLLGFDVEWENPQYTGERFSKVVDLPEATAHVIMLKGYGGRIELFSYCTPKGRMCEPKRQCDFGITHFALSVKNIHEIYDRLLKAGVEFNCPPQDLRPGVCATYLRDPEGVTIELIEYQ